VRLGTRTRLPMRVASSGGIADERLNGMLAELVDEERRAVYDASLRGPVAAVAVPRVLGPMHIRWGGGCDVALGGCGDALASAAGGRGGSGGSGGGRRRRLRCRRSVPGTNTSIRLRRLGWSVRYRRRFAIRKRCLNCRRSVSSAPEPVDSRRPGCGCSRERQGGRRRSRR